MPYATNQGVRIHYHVEGSGPTVMLHHGQSDNLRNWYEAGYIDALKSDFQVVAVDARGHGDSDKPHNWEAYDIARNAEDAAAILDDLGVTKAHFWGHSMGGRIGFGIAKYKPERSYSLIISSMSPYKRPKKERDDQIEMLLQGPEAMLAAREREEGPLSPEDKAKIIANDHLAQAASLTATRDFPDLSDVPPTMTMPCMLYSGDQDTFWLEGQEQCVKEMPNVTFFTLPGLGHQEAFDRSDLVVPQAVEFMKKAQRA